MPRINRDPLVTVNGPTLTSFIMRKPQVTLRFALGARSKLLSLLCKLWDGQKVEEKVKSSVLLYPDLSSDHLVFTAPFHTCVYACARVSAPLFWQWSFITLIVHFRSLTGCPAAPSDGNTVVTVLGDALWATDGGAMILMYSPGLGSPWAVGLCTPSSLCWSPFVGKRTFDDGWQLDSPVGMRIRFRVK